MNIASDYAKQVKEGKASPDNGPVFLVRGEVVAWVHQSGKLTFNQSAQLSPAMALKVAEWINTVFGEEK